MTDTKVTKIYLTGDVSAAVEWNGEKNLIIPVTVNKSATAEVAGRCTIVSYATNAGSTTRAVSSNFSEKCTGNSATATKLERERKITFKGDMIAELVFDGSEDLIISTKVKHSDSADTDGDGKNISETYETKINAAAKFAEKNELPPFTFSIGIFENNPCLLLTDKSGKTFRFIGEAVT